MADRHQMSRLLQASSTQYLQERRITELFESLTAALVHDRPDEPIDYLLRCLRHTAEIGHQNVAFDTFLPSPPTSRSVSAAMQRAEAERPKGMVGDDMCWRLLTFWLSPMGPRALYVKTIQNIRL